MLDMFITQDWPNRATSHECNPCGYVLCHTTEWKKTCIKLKSKGQWDAWYFNQRPTTWNTFMWCGLWIKWTYSMWLLHYVQQNEAKHRLSWSQKGNGMLDTLIKDRLHGIRSCDVASRSNKHIPCGYALCTTEWSKHILSWSWKGNGMLNTFMTKDHTQVFVCRGKPW